MEVFLNITRRLFGLQENLFHYVGAGAFFVWPIKGKNDPERTSLRKEQEEEADRLQQLIQLLVGENCFLHVQIHPFHTVIYLHW